jgi:hypothetical protein
VTDNWRRNLVDIAGGNPILLDPRSLDPDTAQDPDPIPVHPVLYTIAKSFWEFKNSFFAIGRNFFGSHVLGNPRLVNNKLEKNCVNVAGTLDFLSDQEKSILKTIKISDFTRDSVNFVTLDEFTVSNNIRLGAFFLNN